MMAAPSWQIDYKGYKIRIVGDGMAINPYRVTVFQKGTGASLLIQGNSGKRVGYRGLRYGSKSTALEAGQNTVNFDISNLRRESLSASKESE